jgi:hypothetical protein
MSQMNVASGLSILDDAHEDAPQTDIGVSLLATLRCAARRLSRKSKKAGILHDA